MSDARDRLGWSDRWAALAAEHPETSTIGRVVRQDRGWVILSTGTETISAETRARRTGVPVVGDWVVVADEMVTAILERTGALRRADPRGEGEQVLAANLDVVLVVLGLDRPVKPGRIQRAVAQIWDAAAEPIAVLTKADLVDDLEAVVALVDDEHPGLDVVAVSAHTGHGMDALRRRIQGRTVALLGESGAGKSSLLNALAVDAVAEIGDVRDGDSKGRHTTTRRELFLLTDGTIIIDTPGVRGLGVIADIDSIDATFPDVEEAAAECRFNDCSHDHEPGCGVLAAIEAGTLPVERLDAYRGLVAESEWAGMNEHERKRSGRRPPGR